MDLGLDERGNKLGELGTNSSALCDKLKKFQENAAEISEKEKGRIFQKVDKNEKKTTDDSKVKEIEDSLGEIKESIKDNVQKLLDEEAETDALVIKADLLKSQSTEYTKKSRKYTEDRQVLLRRVVIGCIAVVITGAIIGIILIILYLNGNLTD